MLRTVRVVLSTLRGVGSLKITLPKGGNGKSAAPAPVAVEPAPVAEPAEAQTLAPAPTKPAVLLAAPRAEVPVVEEPPVAAPPIAPEVAPTASVAEETAEDEGPSDDVAAALEELAAPDGEEPEPEAPTEEVRAKAEEPKAADDGEFGIDTLIGQFTDDEGPGFDDEDAPLIRSFRGEKLKAIATEVFRCAMKHLDGNEAEAREAQKKFFEQAKKKPWRWIPSKAEEFMENRRYWHDNAPAAYDRLHEWLRQRRLFVKDERGVTPIVTAMLFHEATFDNEDPEKDIETLIRNGHFGDWEEREPRGESPEDKAGDEATPEDVQVHEDDKNWARTQKTNSVTEAMAEAGVRGVKPADLTDQQQRDLDLVEEFRTAGIPSIRQGKKRLKALSSRQDDRLSLEEKPVFHLLSRKPEKGGGLDEFSEALTRLRAEGLIEDETPPPTEEPASKATSSEEAPAAAEEPTAEPPPPDEAEEANDRTPEALLASAKGTLGQIGRQKKALEKAKEAGDKTRAAELEASIGNLEEQRQQTLNKAKAKKTAEATPKEEAPQAW